MAITGYSYFELVIFLVKVLFLFLHYATVECIGDYFDNRQCGANCSVRFPSLNDLFCCDTKGDRDGEEDRESKGDGDKEVNRDREEIGRGGRRR
jgi:hypothetical protein